MSFVSNFKKLTGTSRGKLPLHYLNLYFCELFAPCKVSVAQQLEIRKLKRLLNGVQVNDNILLFLHLIAHSAAESQLEDKHEHHIMQFEVVSQVNYWPVLAVKPVDPVDILCRPVMAIKDDDVLSNKSIDSGYDSFFENDVYSVSCSKDIVSCLLGINSKSFILDSDGQFRPSRELVLKSRNINVYAVFCQIGSKMKKLLDNIHELE